MILDTESLCPRCRSSVMKTWPELDDDQKMLAERLSGSAEFTPKQRKKHRFCTRCWFESGGYQDPNLKPAAWA